MTGTLRPSTAGRSCPASYGYSPAVFARPPEVVADVIYVIGGLYGNRAALSEILSMAAREGPEVALVFNGDFHWFDAEAASFAAVDDSVASHTSLRGNVETEIAGDDERHGCGCAYPESVPDADVQRSNDILARLREVARDLPAVRTRLAGLPMHCVAQIGTARIAIVHGDAWSLAGWRFAHDALHAPANHAKLEAAFEQAAVDGFASSHTCLPALKTFDTASGRRFVINNGAAGMPNFKGSRCGLMTRLARAPVPAPLQAHRQYGAKVGELAVDALAVHFDVAAWDAEFTRLWPSGSAAHRSYARRIADGPEFSLDDALGRGQRARVVPAIA